MRAGAGIILLFSFEAGQGLVYCIAWNRKLADCYVSGGRGSVFM